MEFVLCENCFMVSRTESISCSKCGVTLENLNPVKGNMLEGAIIEDKFKLESYIDEGAMAWVYKGVHISLGSSVAIKILKPAFQSDSRFVERFRKEAIAAGSLNHPNILSIINSDSTPTGITYIISEFLSGRPLSKIIAKEGNLELERSLRIINQILSGLDEAHQKGIIHRDIKPENIMVKTLRSGEDHAKVVDFGIAKQTESQDAKLTKHGEIFGTPEYIAPELIRGQDAVPASDLYSVGIILYELLTGKLPFTGDVVFDILKAHMDDAPQNPREINPDIPVEIENIILQALSKNPEDRYSDAMIFKKAINSPFKQKRRACPSCGFVLNSHHKFCPDCGKKITKIPNISRTQYNSTKISESLQKIIRKETIFKPFFVGRETEIQKVESFLKSDKTVLEINGSEGMGKTCLVQEIVNRFSQFKQVEIALVNAHPAGINLPWYPVRNLIRKLLGLKENFSEKDLSEAIDKLNLEHDDLPFISLLFGIKKMNNKLERSVLIRELITTISRTIIAAAQQKNLILIFEDIDRYDFPSRLLIDRLISIGGKSGIRIIVTSEESFIQEGVISDSIILRRIDNQKVESVLLNLKHNSSNTWSELTQNLIFNALGHPLHLEQGIRLLLEGGNEVNKGLVDLITLRIRRLPKEAMKIMQLCGLYGMQIHLDLVKFVLSDNNFVESGIKVLIKRGFLKKLSDTTFSLTHPIYMKIIPSLMTSKLQNEFYQKIMEYLERKQSSPYLLVKFASRANDLERSKLYLAKAASKFEEDFDDIGASSAYQKLFDILKISLLEQQDLQQFSQVCAKLGDLYRYTGQLKKSLGILKEGLMFCEEQPEYEAVILSSLARTLFSLKSSKSNKISSIIRRTSKIIKSLRNPDILYNIYFNFSTIELGRKNFNQGEKLLNQGLSHLSELSKKSPKFWRLFLRLAEFQFNQKHHEQAIATLMEGLRISQNQQIAKGRIHQLLGEFFLHLGRNEDALAHIKKAAEILYEIGDRMSASEAFIKAAENTSEKKDELLKKALYLSMQIGWKDGIEKVDLLKN